MRIAYLVSQYPAVNHAFMLREIRSLRGRGFEIHVASIRRPDRAFEALSGAEREEERGTHYVKSAGLAQAAVAHLATFVRRPIRYLHGLGEALDEGNVLYFVEAVVVGHWMRGHELRHVHTHYASTVGVMVARMFPVSLSITFHGPAEFADAREGELAEKVRASLFACAISRYGLSQLMCACGYQEWQKLELTPLGIDPAEFPARPLREAISAFRMICVGRLAAVKGQHVLLAALERLVKGGRNVELQFVGDGPDRQSLERDVESRGLSGCVVFQGNVNQDRLRELYRESDVLVLASFAEGLPVVVMEAMAMEIPCVATWVNGIPEIITHERDGLLVPPGDAEALACAVTRLMDDPALRRELGEKARLKVLEKFHLQRNTEHLADVFRRRLQ